MRRNTATTPDASNPLVRSLPLLDGLAPPVAAAIVTAAAIREFDAGATVFAEGHTATAFFVVLSGSVKLVQLTDDGDAIVFRLLGPGDAFGTAAILEREPYPVSAYAVTATSTLRWPAAVMRRLAEEHSRLSLNLLRNVSERLQALRLQYRQLATEKVERRIARALLRLSDRLGTPAASGGIVVQLPLSREDIAQLTGTTPYTVSRVISRWEAAGLLQAKRHRLVIRQPQALASIADDEG